MAMANTEENVPSREAKSEHTLVVLSTLTVRYELRLWICLSYDTLCVCSLAYKTLTRTVLRFLKIVLPLELQTDIYCTLRN